MLASQGVMTPLAAEGASCRGAATNVMQSKEVVWVNLWESLGLGCAA